MKLSYKSGLLAGALVCFGILPSAFGQTQLTFTGGTGPGNDGQQFAGEQTSPYQFQVGDPSNTVELICDSFSLFISGGETWQATAHTLTDTGGCQWDGGACNDANYAAAGVLAIELLTETTNPPVDLQTGMTESDVLSYAIWQLFDTSTPPGLANLNDQQLVANAITAAAGAVSGFSLDGYSLANVVIYTAIPGTQTGNLGTPQEFIGITTPEASSAAVLGVDLLGFGGVLLFLRRRASRVA